jgi:hypothetical protein
LGSSGNRSIARRAAPAMTALVLAACIGLAAVAWKSYGDVAKKKIARLVTQFVVTSSLQSEEAAPTSPPAVLTAASPDPSPLVQTPQLVGTDSEAPTSGSAQLLQSMARDLSALAREVEQLKAGMEQMKVTQQQTARDAAQSSEQKLRTRISAAALRSAEARSRKPPSFSAPPPAAAPAFRQAAEPPYVPRQPETLADPGVSSVPRPPMPVR